MYAIGGIELPEKNYMPLSYDIDEVEKELGIEEIEVDRYNQIQDRLDKMRTTNRKNRVQRLSVGSLSIRWAQA